MCIYNIHTRFLIISENMKYSQNFTEFNLSVMLTGFIRSEVTTFRNKYIHIIIIFSPFFTLCEIQLISSCMNSVVTIQLHLFNLFRIVDKLNSYGQVLSIIPKLQEWDYLIMSGRQWTYGSHIELSLLWYPPGGSYKNYPTKSLIVYNCSSSPSRHVSLVFIYIVN